MQLKKTWGYLIGAALLLLIIKYSESIFNGAKNIMSIMMPMIIGCAIAYVLNILVSKIESLPVFKNPNSKIYKFKRAVSIVGAILIIVLVFYLIIQIVIPQLMETFSVVITGIPPVLEKIAKWLSQYEMPLPQIEELINSLNLNWPQLVQKAISYIYSRVESVFSITVKLLGNIGGIIFQFVVSLIFALYILSGKEKLKCQFCSLVDVYLKKETGKRIMYVLSTANDSFSKFIVGQCTEAVIIGVLCTAGMFILQFPYATMVGTLIGATALLPIIGAYLGAAVGAFMILTVSPIKAIAFLVFIVILQQLEGNLIYPRVVGSSIGLPGIWVLAAVTIGGGLGGIIGMLLAVPITATIYKLVKTDVAKKTALKEITSKDSASL